MRIDDYRDYTVIMSNDYLGELIKAADLFVARVNRVSSDWRHDIEPSTYDFDTMCNGQIDFEEVLEKMRRIHSQYQRKAMVSDEY